jgi:hypothetical protein
MRPRIATPPPCDGGSLWHKKGDGSTKRQNGATGARRDPARRACALLCRPVRNHPGEALLLSFTQGSRTRLGRQSAAGLRIHIRAARSIGLCRRFGFCIVQGEIAERSRLWVEAGKPVASPGRSRRFGWRGRPRAGASRGGRIGASIRPEAKDRSVRDRGLRPGVEAKAYRGHDPGRARVRACQCHCENRAGKYSGYRSARRKGLRGSNSRLDDSMRRREARM